MCISESISQRLNWIDWSCFEYICLSTAALVWATIDLSLSWLMLMAIYSCFGSTPTEQSLITCLDGRRITLGFQWEALAVSWFYFFPTDSGIIRVYRCVISNLFFCSSSFLLVSEGWVDEVKSIIYSPSHSSCAYWFHLKFNFQIGTDSIRK